MRSVTNLLLFNMALSDFISTVFFVPSALAVEISPNSWPLGDFMCRAPPVIGTVSVSVSIYSMVALAVERCGACAIYLDSSLISRNQVRVIIDGCSILINVTQCLSKSRRKISFFNISVSVLVGLYL